MVDDIRTFLRSPVFYRPRAVARNFIHKHVERPVVRAHTVARALHHGGELLHFGDSSLMHIAADDPDIRRVGELLADNVGLRPATYFGPGYSPGLYAPFARLLRDQPRPRAAVVCLGVRNSTHSHVIDHPFYAYRRAIAALRGTDHLGPAVLRKAYKKLPSPEEYVAFEALPHRTRPEWSRATTQGEYRSLLRGYAMEKAARYDQQTLFTYFHGESSEGRPGLQNWTELGQHLAALEIPVVAYRVYMPLELGSQLLGPEFRDHIDANFTAVETAFRAGYTGDLELVDRPMADDAFINPFDGTEHYRLKGRLEVVDAVSAQLERMLRRPSGVR